MKHKFLSKKFSRRYQKLLIHTQDFALHLPTGSGKTVVAFAIGDWYE
ncbi:hypothetical protein [Calothrix sp. NIES-2100]